jgi:hypothetical protein
MDKYHFCIAGKTPGGETIIEQWCYGATTGLGTGVPSVLPVIPTGGGEVHYVWNLPPRVQVNEIVRVSAGGHNGVVRGLIHSLQSADKVFVYYDASREVHLLNLTTHSSTVQASPVPVSGALTVADLSNDYRRMWAVNRIQRGYCYFFLRDSGPPQPSQAQCIVLIDQDRDGKVDVSESISGAQWIADGWSNPANYTVNPLFL